MAAMASATPIERQILGAALFAGAGLACIERRPLATGFSAFRLRSAG
jgi:hypothetical protein